MGDFFDFDILSLQIFFPIKDKKAKINRNY